MDIVKYGALAVLALIVLGLMLIGILSVTRGGSVKIVLAEGDDEGPCDVRDPHFLRLIELFTETHVEAGNKVDILLNGEGTYPRLWKDLESATQTLTVQLYYSQPGAVADTMAKYLSERAKAGVRVLLLLDAFGSEPLPNEWIEGLRASGVRVNWLRPIKWYTLHKTAQRSHVRAIVIDGRVGYTGGFGLADYWLGDGRHADQWRETNVRFEGPAVAALQAAFAAGWVETEEGELLTGAMFFPPIEETEGEGNVNAGLMHSMPTIGSTPGEHFIALTIAAAEKTLYISNAYFVPNVDFCGLLVKAAKKGVDVRVLTVSAETDVKTTWYAGRALYEGLLEGGVRIYEYLPAMMHAKTIVVDGVWACIGSMNFDNRSIAFNNESQILALDDKLGEQLQDIFLADLDYAEEIKLETFRKRPLKGKVYEWGAQKLRRVL